MQVVMELPYRGLKCATLHKPFLSPLFFFFLPLLHIFKHFLHNFDSNSFLAHFSVRFLKYLPTHAPSTHVGGDGAARPGAQVCHAPQEAGPAGGQDVGGAGRGRRAQEPRLLRRPPRTGIRGLTKATF